MSAQPAIPGRFRRMWQFLRRWALRGLVVVAVVNLGWDLWSWQDRSFAEGDRRFFRGAEQGHEIDYGLADLRIINETGREYLIDSFVLDGWLGFSAGKPDAERTLSPAGEPGSSHEDQRYLDRLVSSGSLILREGATGPRRTVEFEVDRRRPTSCSIVLRVREEGVVVSECRPLRRIRTAYRWLFYPPNYY
jgi:hypothetical protein